MKIFCSGIGGIGLSAYASHMRMRGHEVLGSDRSDSPILAGLREIGVTVTLVQDGTAVPEGLDLFVYSEAIPEDAPEREQAKKKGVRQISYFAALGELTKGTKLIIVCGTHGKSSTTAMVARVFIELGLDPNVVVGTKMRELNGKNWRMSDSDLWVVEACEYRRSFLSLSPGIALVTNADGDHFDAFKDQEDYESAFVQFLQKIPETGMIISHGEDPIVQGILKKAGKATIDADKEPMPVVSTPGLHMRKNAQLVYALSLHMGLDTSKVVEALKGFEGTWRRMEIKVVRDDGTVVIDDYAHHPVEIRATLSALKEAYPNRRIVCVFQPHTHDRTKKLWNGFTTAFKDAHLLLVPNIYDARPDTNTGLVDVDEFLRDIAKGSGIQTMNTKSLPETIERLQSEILKPRDVLVVMGAGDITKVAEAM